MARALASSCTRHSTLLTMRLFSTTTTTTTTAISLRKSPILSQSPRRSVYALSQVFFTPTTRFGGIRCRVNRAGDSAYSPLNSSGSNSFSDRPPTEMAPLFPGCDYNHWLIVMDKPGGEGATKQDMIDCYVQTLAKVLGSEEEAKKKIYNVSCERYFGFGCEIDEETSNKFEGMNGVLFVLPDSYVDPEYKDYGAELFVNGEIVQRPPERQRRVEPQQQRHQTDQGTMIEQGMSGVEKTRSGEAPACNKEGSYVHTMGVVHSMRYLVLESISF
ncbi:LOW QUALITY PROTEIN: multiple organellar RNA editing factor 2, chloroplastic-like [Lotus japonicus]|uniref:LOW QUALITY PROTEIN: multiple organellar RNA editing factor 2, chloroplastic-like n=1 Tax=Lotus japonicus TaxID=34305 RepID=UPI0025830785|nr:LOW QUALITY PROTEIN: multiple organellar RNA editing factor 2, chloroplastic-like [Lotus japonicus]